VHSITPLRVTGITGVRAVQAGYAKDVFLFFSNRVGCLGSIALSIVVTLVLITVLQLL
jgi:hypothetical protein